jgi:purine catabolism regulator
MAGVTVREILTLTVMSGAQVIAGEAGLDRQVTGVNVMEVPDIEAFVKRGEILLTTGFPIRERPQRLVELVPELARQGLAALAIKPMRYLERLPDELISVADTHRFPLLVMPDDTSFNDVIGAVLAVVLADYGADPAGAEYIRERLTGVALSGGGLDGIAAALSAAVASNVTILDHEDVVIGAGTHRALGGTDPAPPAAAAPHRFPITVGGMVRGHILVEAQREPTLGQRRLIRQACFAAGMQIAQAVASLELDRKMRTLFLEELVAGVEADGPTVRQRSRLFGWDLAGPHCVMLARTSSELGDAAVTAAARQRLPAGSLAWLRGSEVVAVLPTEGGLRFAATIPALMARWRAALLELGSASVVVAMGTMVDGPGELSRSHLAAREALRIADATGQVAVRHDDLMLERLLLNNPTDVLEEFVEAQVGDLVRHDEQTGAELCRTLAVYLGVGNGAEAARQLFVHYNTMKHRLQRIAELTAADLHDPRTRLRLAVALEAQALLAGRRARTP